jgi:hypothetical protein
MFDDGRPRLNLIALLITARLNASHKSRDGAFTRLLMDASSTPG